MSKFSGSEIKERHIAHVLFTALLTVVLFTGCEKRQPTAVQQPPPAVTVATPISSEVIRWREFTGRLDAVNSVEVRARVSGYLQSVNFNEGDIVKEGDLLFVIDPRPYQAELERVRGQLATAKAKESLTQIELNRAKQLLEQRAYAQETYDQRLAAARQAAGELEAAEAAVAMAELNVEFTQIKAPISGKIGRAIVTEGNLIDGGSSQSILLTTIVSLDPIYVFFTVDEQAHLQWIRLRQEGKIPTGVKFPVWFGLADEQGFPHQATIDFVNNRIDSNTATLNIRAVAPNPDRIFTPGLFVKVRAPASGIYKVLLIPDDVITSDQAYKVVYVVNEKGVVERRNVEIGALEQDLRVVRSGLNPTDSVIINGIQRARPGQPVTAQPGTIAYNAREAIPQAVRDIFERHAANPQSLTSSKQ
jgi:RND family efflux transporter MFP subunit